MYVATLLADPSCLRLERIISSAVSLTLVVRTTAPTAACPRCGTMSKRVHSRYARRVADLPWHGVAVRLELRARKFFCANDGCPQRVFTERLPRVVAPHARRTRRLNEALTLLAFALGGEAGARAAVGLGMAVGADTFLARVRGAALPERQTLSVLGVDDWAKLKGQRYGTILVDLEPRRVALRTLTVSATAPSSSTSSAAAPSSCCQTASQRRSPLGCAGTRALKSSAATAAEPTPKARARAHPRRCRSPTASTS